MKDTSAHLSLTIERRGGQSDMILPPILLLALFLTSQGCGRWDEPLFPSAAYKAFKEQYDVFVAVEPGEDVKGHIKRSFVKPNWVPGKMVVLYRETKEASIWSSERWLIQFPLQDEKVLRYEVLARQPSEVSCVLFVFRRYNHDVDVYIVDIKTKEMVAFQNLKDDSWYPSKSWAPGYHPGGRRMITWERDILPWLNGLAATAGLERKPRE